MSATAPLAHAVREIAAPTDRVYAAWIDPQLVMQWMFKPDEPAVHARTQPKVGGSFSYCITRGGQDVDHAGSYLELEPPTRLVFTWGGSGPGDAQSRVTVTIRARDADRCTCAVDHALLPEYAAMVDTCAGSWARMLERLAKRFAAGQDRAPAPR